MKRDPLTERNLERMGRGVCTHCEQPVIQGRTNLHGVGFDCCIRRWRQEDKLRVQAEIDREVEKILNYPIMGGR